MDKPEAKSGSAGVIVALLLFAGLGLLLLVVFLAIGGLFMVGAAPMAMPTPTVINEVTEEKSLTSSGSVSASPADVKLRKARSGLHEIRVLLDTYRLDVGSYPPNPPGLNGLLVRPVDLEETTVWRGPYADRIAADPWGQLYHYDRTSPTDYRLWSTGPDGEHGTPDDIELSTSEAVSGDRPESKDAAKDAATNSEP